jgi:hypothetical protein
MLPIKALVGSMVILAAASSATRGQSDLAQTFRDPPAKAAPHTWWHWMNGNITREGITADLEAMKGIGLAGAQIFNVSESIPPGPVLFMSPEWRDLLKHAVKEADRLGLELCIHNCAGWSSSGGPWITPEHAMQMVVTSETKIEGGRRFEGALAQPETHLGFYRDIAVLAFPTPRDDTARIKDLKVKAGYESRYNQQPALDEFPADSVIKRQSILDLTSVLGGDGRLNWDAPAGAWTILRIGYTPTGAKNAPAPESGRGLECDKLSRDGLDAHWAGMMAKVVQDLGPLAGKTLNNCLIDSYEVGGQNWTARFRDEFTRRRGYDPLVYLPVLSGRIVESGEVSERFLWDLRRTIADLFADNYYSYFAELCRKNGLKASIEPYDGPYECLLSGRDADIPMGEFWVGGGESSSCKLAASVAHTYGRPIVGAESFTAEPSVGRWLNHPGSLKGVGDLMLTVGISRFIIHRYAHQPWLDKVPGMTMGQWGTHFERTVTWWNQGSAWIRYLTRCQSLLQQGMFDADVCFFDGDAAPNDARHDPALKAKGYDYDACNADVLFNRMSVKDGRLVLPDGMSYRVLVLPSTTFVTPRTLGRVRELVQQGATVIGPRPTKSPSLADYPKCDAAVGAMASELWADTDMAAGEHVLGKGRVIWGRAPEQVLGSMGVGPDCQFAGGGKISWIHRTVDGAEVYFVSNQTARSQEVDCTFRTGGKAPELWHPESGEMEPAPVWSEADGRTTVAVRFDPWGSAFVVFRKPAGQEDHLVAMKRPEAAGTARAPKIEIRKATYEATDGTGGADVTEKVAAMVHAGETTIPANNALFGDPTYLHVKRLRVEYTLDGKPVSRTAEENGALELVAPGPDAPAAANLAWGAKGPELLAFQEGVYEFHTARNKTSSVTVKQLPAPLDIRGPWKLRFPPGRGAPPSVTLDALVSWAEHDDPGVKYFSGTAEYEKEFEVPPELLGPGKVLELNLGDVQCIAEVTLNGTDLGTWWTPPFAADISKVAKPGANTLKIRVTNLWVNRLIGDEQFPDDCEWNGKPLKRWPEWLLKGEPRPVKERLTFTTWKHYTKDSPLVPSGLIGPVVVRVGERVPVE